ncbi:hypothetical protein PGT21_017507 [Puccinia graminis f. sp. tritici]|uniref:Uncharacterized protein n=2 Tax=Puccinia graminis f. sp. tritici TaxID=56615 RepID=A0A5B0RI27_PUCGR|nr:hypothetical protein PGT21_017507 [Puccinia graminis f. sp. tritici]KAA1125476.1 hypothetical protein PGTUg99_001776 [Puccinia graminis f. sp. tritici]
MYNFVISHDFRGSKICCTFLALVLGLFLIDKPAHAAENQNSQSNLCLDPSLIQQAAKSNGLKDPTNPLHNTKSLTSSNNFLDFCRGARLTNGEQVPEGSCNPTPMGSIPSKQNMPSVRIIGPSPDAIIPPNADFDVDIYAHKIELGFFTSPSNTYYLAPQQLSSKGLIRGHTHIVIQRSVGRRVFETQETVFFKGVTNRTVNGQVKTPVKGGLPAGFYRISTLTAAMNHQPVVLPVAQRGAVDDAIYIRVGSSRRASKKRGSKKKSAEASDNASNTSNGVSDGASDNSSDEKTVGKSKHKKDRKACRAKKRKS